MPVGPFDGNRETEKLRGIQNNNRSAVESERNRPSRKGKITEHGLGQRKIMDGFPIAGPSFRTQMTQVEEI